MTDSVYEAQLRRQLYEARQQVTALRADRARLEDEVGPLRQQLDGANRRVEHVEQRLVAVRELVQSWRSMGGVQWAVDRVLAALDGPKGGPRCSRCGDRKVVPDWSNWDRYHGEPRPKPCPGCASGECTSVCADGHMYDGDCQVAPLDGLPESAGISGPTGGQHAGWAWRCWGTDSCDGLLSLDHASQAAARRSYDRHAKREHAGAAS